MDGPGLIRVGGELAVSMERNFDEALESHFDKGPLQEDLTFAYYRLAQGRRRQSLVLSRPALPGDGDRILQGNVAFTQKYLQRVLDECPAGVGIALMHSHLGPGWQGMSEDDVVAERDRLAAAVGGRTGLPLLGMTWGTDGAWSARVWVREAPFRYGRRDVHLVRSVGPRLRVTFHPVLAPTPEVGKSQVASVSVWGEEAQSVLARLRVGIVGLGSVGSIVAEGLARIGVSRFVLVDHDRIELRNLDRTAGATRADARLRRHKVSTAARHIRESATSESLELDVYRGSLLTRGGLVRILDCDVVFSCVDRPWPRHLINSVAYANLLPVIDGGILVRVDDGRLLHADWRIHTVGPGMACLVCLGALDSGDVGLDVAGLLDDPDYMRGLSAAQRETYARRNVFPMSLSVAAHELLHLAGLVSGDDRVRGIGPQRYHGYPGAMEAEPRSDCREDCGYSALTASAIDLSGTFGVK